MIATRTGEILGRVERVRVGSSAKTTNDEG